MRHKDAVVAALLFTAATTGIFSAAYPQIGAVIAGLCGSAGLLVIVVGALDPNDKENA